MVLFCTIRNCTKRISGNIVNSSISVYSTLYVNLYVKVDVYSILLLVYQLISNAMALAITCSFCIGISCNLFVGHQCFHSNVILNFLILYDFLKSYLKAIEVFVLISLYSSYLFLCHLVVHKVNANLFNFAFVHVHFVDVLKHLFFIFLFLTLTTTCVKEN